MRRTSYRIPLPGGRELVLGERTLVMGILNITPDSFADGGAHLDLERAVDAGLRMVADGADILDVGGESTRPGADEVGAEEEMRRVLPVIERLARETGALISIDTYKAAVAREAVARGATIINDISGLQYDPELGAVAARTQAALVLMHTRGRSRTMHEHATYDDVVRDVARELSQSIDRAISAGVRRESLILDPGFGFAKRAAHSYTLLARLPELADLDRPILSGPSRKSFLKEALGERTPAEREWGTAAAVSASVLFGAHIVRVHGVRAMADVVRVADRLR
ncbi:MAG TPA: dihydropteroate synthase, partial [Vicinamibacterales bacterium]|nr:dihydropteroate synthase [Vicinamibacterales bacterium]